MKAKVKKLFVEALRSKKYRKITGQLKSMKGFCAAGVLCELYRQEKKKGEWCENQFEIKPYTASSATPPEAVYKWAGVKAYEIYKIIAMNDLTRKSFKQIADYVEKEM